jgi:teichoic acid transport system ATP-binding protein
MVADHLSVTYEVYADRQPSLRELVANRFRGRRARSIEAVQDVSFVAHPGETIGLIGHNGSGKSTMLRALAGLIPASSGDVYAAADPVLLGVKAALVPEISGRRNVFLGGTALGVSRDTLQAAMPDIIAFSGLEQFIDVPMRAYSSGMSARLQFAIATVVTPRILLIDEALAVGDQQFRKRSIERIEAMMEDAGTVFLVSHGLGVIERVCTRVLWMDHGRLVADGDPAELVEAYREEMER